MKAKNSTRPTDPRSLLIRGKVASTNPLECALKKNLPASPLESALAESLDLISPEMNTYTKQGGTPLFSTIVNSDTGSAGYNTVCPSKHSAIERRSYPSRTGNLIEGSSSVTNHVEEYSTYDFAG